MPEHNRDSENAAPPLPEDHVEEEVVWRLPPSFDGSADDPEMRAAVEAIGESNRMTLKFVKPE